MDTFFVLWASEIFFGLFYRLGYISLINYLKTLSSVLTEQLLSFSASFCKSIMIRFYKLSSVKMLSWGYVFSLFLLKLLKSSLIYYKLYVNSFALYSYLPSKMSLAFISGGVCSLMAGGDSTSRIFFYIDDSVSLFELPSRVTLIVWPLLDLIFSSFPLPRRVISFLINS